MKPVHRGKIENETGKRNKYKVLQMIFKAMKSYCKSAKICKDCYQNCMMKNFVSSVIADARPHKIMKIS